MKTNTVIRNRKPAPRTFEGGKAKRSTDLEALEWPATLLLFEDDCSPE